MNERYTWEIRETKLGEAQVVVDNTKEDCWYGTAMSICEILNCKEERIKELEEENEQLRNENGQLDQIIELQDKYRILEFNHSRLEKRNKAQYEKIGEQQAEIERLKEQLSLVCKAESSAPYNSVKEVLRRQIFGLDCAAEESANAWNHYCVLNKLFQEQYGEYWDNED